MVCFGAAVAANRIGIATWFSCRHPMFGPDCFILGCLICWLPWPKPHDHIVAIGAALLLVAILASASLRSGLNNAPRLWLGKQSHSLYLSHLPLIMVVVILFRGNVPVPTCGAVIPAAVVLGWAFHRWAERPSVVLRQQLVRYSSRAVQTTRRRQNGATAAANVSGANTRIEPP